MAASLSAYWVKFFKGAGFPQDVATKHAVVFSNNRIKPDMLPDLDKPSLKEMGITLMGDMIAILRYAKKVVEETTCERFLVDSEDSTGATKIVAKPVVKKVIAKAPTKTITSKLKPDTATVKKTIKVPSTTVTKTTMVKKPISTSNNVSSEMSTPKKQTVVKRKIQQEEDEYESSNEDDWNGSAKKAKTSDDKDKVGYTITIPQGLTVRSQQTLKKSTDQKRTVFDRLGDSSVTSTTNLAETTPTFNITGLGRDVYKRSASVFNRLGDKDAKKDNNTPQTGILKNGTTSTISPGILKTRPPTARTSIITTKKLVPKTIGTMRADQEPNKKVSNSVKQLVKTTKKITFNDSSLNNVKSVKSHVSSGKLASERLATIPAKARLGVVRSSGAKQVTFNRIATVSHVKRPDVFSRLGI